MNPRGWPLRGRRPPSRLARPAGRSDVSTLRPSTTSASVPKDGRTARAARCPAAAPPPRQEHAFNEARVRTAVETQEKAYRLLRRLRERPSADRSSFARAAHSGSDDAAAVTQWPVQLRDVTTADPRPAPDRRAEFARFFATLLATSFETSPLSSRLLTRRCGCRVCAALIRPQSPKPRRVTPADHRLAGQLVEDHAAEMAEPLNLRLTAADVDRVLGDCGEQAALAAYGGWLVRRLDGRTPGPALLSLWRRFAWRDGRPRRGYRLTADAIVAAQAGLESRLIADRSDRA